MPYHTCCGSKVLKFTLFILIKGEGKMKLAEYLKQGKITKQRNHYRCETCNYYTDTPFEAIKCHASHKRIPTDAETYWSAISTKQKNTTRKAFNTSENYNDFETVADFAYRLMMENKNGK